MNDRIVIVYLCKAMTTKPIPVFARRIFWDVDFDKLDYEGKADFVIVRVFERGDVPDVRNCRRYYGDERVKAALLTAKYLSIGTHHFVSSIFALPFEQFRCYTTKQSSPERLPY